MAGAVFGFKGISVTHILVHKWGVGGSDRRDLWNKFHHKGKEFHHKGKEFKFQGSWLNGKDVANLLTENNSACMLHLITHRLALVPSPPDLSFSTS